MNVGLIYLLLGLYFIGVSFPGLLSRPVSKETLAQFAYGVVLVVLAVVTGVKLT